MQISILNGVYTDEASDFRTSYPRNLIPVPVQNGISRGYLQPAEGIVAYGDTAPGISRGGINWNGTLYRVMGNQLCSITADGTITQIGDVTGTVEQCKLDYSFDYLSINSNKNFYLYDGTTLTKVTDIDLGDVIDHIFVDGYFMTTDGSYLVVNELADPFSILPTKYGSSEADPDPIKALLKMNNEPHALNRYTIEVFDNIGGTGFPFQRIDGALISRGTVGTHSCCVFQNAIAFVGGGRNESISVWLGGGGNSIRIATREIDLILAEYTESVLENKCIVETRVDKGHQHLIIHLPDKTLVYDAAASKVANESVWFILSSDVDPTVDSVYNARDLVWCYDKWLVGDTITGKLGYLSTDTSNHWGNAVGWKFQTSILYNEGRDAIIHELELVALTGRAILGNNPTIYTDYSKDGEFWSMPKGVSAGKRGERNKRLMWLNQGSIGNFRIQRFYGTSEARISFARLEARIEGLM